MILKDLTEKEMLSVVLSEALQSGGYFERGTTIIVNNVSGAERRFTLKIQRGEE